MTRLLPLLVLVACGGAPAPGPAPAAAPAAPAPAAAPPPAAAPAPAPAAAPYPTQVGAVDYRSRTPLGTWVNSAAVPHGKGIQGGIETTLVVTAAGAKVDAEGYQTSLHVDATLTPVATGGWDVVVTADRGSLAPHAAGEKLFFVEWIGSTIVGRNNHGPFFEIPGGGQIADFQLTVADPAGICKNESYKCDGQMVVRCDGGTWVLAETCDAQHHCMASSLSGACMDNEPT